MSVDEDTGRAGLRRDAAVSIDARAAISPLTVIEAMLSTLPDPVFVIDRQGRYLYVGEVAMRLLDKPASAILGKTVQEIGFSPEAAADLAAHTEQVFRTGLRAISTDLIPTVHGPRWYDHHYSPIRDDQDEVVGMLCIANDVTERVQLEAERARRQNVQAARQETADALHKQTEQRRQEAEIAALHRDLQRRLHEIETIFQTVPVALNIADDTACLRIHGNPATYHMLRLPQGVNVSKTGPSEERPSFRVFRDGQEIPSEDLPMQMAARTGQEVRDVELDIVWDDGVVCHWYGSASPLFDEHGATRGSVGAFVDITQRKQAEARLRQSEEQSRQQARLLDTLLDNIPTGVTVAEPPNVTILKLSRYGELDSGGGREQFEGKRQSEVLGDVYHRDGVTLATEAELPLTRATREGEVIRGEEWVVIHPHTGEKLVLLCNASPVRDDGGNVVLGILAWSDITMLKAAHEEIARLNARLHRSVYEASHRIKNQLQVLTASADLVLMDGQEVVAAAAFRRLRSQIEAIATTHDLLTNETRADGTAEHISLKALLYRTLASLQQTTDRHRLRYTFDDVVVPLKAATSLALIVNEAVSNAIKHGGEMIDITLVTVEGTGQLEVCDDGPGFPVGFDARQAANTGLELIMTLTRIDLSGRVEFENRARGGGRVRVTFPLLGTH